MGFFEKVETTCEIIPKPGRIRMYTSGWPKNQNRFKNSSGSPPPAGSKKVVPKLRSVSSIVIAPASTGSANSSRKAVTRIDHTKSGMRCKVMPGARILKIVVMKLIELMIDDAPARCSAKMTMSTDGPGWPPGPAAESGGYTVQPTAAP